MRPTLFPLLLTLLLPVAAHAQQEEVFPDGKHISAWFSESGKVDISTRGKQYVVTRYGVRRDSTRVQPAASRPSSNGAVRRNAFVFNAFQKDTPGINAPLYNSI